jgi:hypothetical protein
VPLFDKPSAKIKSSGNSHRLICFIATPETLTYRATDVPPHLISVTRAF